MMKKIIFWTAITFSFFLSSAALADYVIKLKNGRSLPTPKFWEEKGEIKFYWANGIAGIPKEDILFIRRTKEAPGVGISFPREAAPKLKEAIEKPEGIPPEGKKTSEVEAEKDKIDVEYYKKQKAFFMGKYNQAYERYLEATSRRDEEAKKKALEEFNLFGAQAVTLEEELKKKNKGVLPKWWKQ